MIVLSFMVGKDVTLCFKERAQVRMVANNKQVTGETHWPPPFSFVNEPEHRL